MDAGTGISMNPAEVSIQSRTTTSINSLELMSDESYFKATGGEVMNESTKWSIRTLMHEFIIPKLKFITDDADEWKYPNLSKKNLNSNKIIDLLLEKLNVYGYTDRQKMDFWTCYRDYVRNLMNEHRSNVRNKMKIRVLEGNVLEIYACLLLFLCHIITHIYFCSSLQDREGNLGAIGSLYEES